MRPFSWARSETSDLSRTRRRNPALDRTASAGTIPPAAPAAELLDRVDKDIHCAGQVALRAFDTAKDKVLAFVQFDRNTAKEATQQFQTQGRDIPPGADRQFSPTALPTTY